MNTSLRPGRFLATAATLVVAAAVLAVGDLGDTYGLKRLVHQVVSADGSLRGTLGAHRGGDRGRTPHPHRMGG